MQLEISKSNDLIASSCAGFGINFAVKVPVPALKENRQYLLVRTDHHLVWKIAPGGQTRRQSTGPEVGFAETLGDGVPRTFLGFYWW